jgi:signal transduction histidine kinase
MDNIKILVLDNEPSTANTCISLLKDTVYQIFTVSSTAQTTGLLGQEKYDLLVVDIDLVESQEFNLFKQMALYQPDLAILVMASKRKIQKAVLSFRHGANGLLLKPLNDKQDLVEAIEQALNDNHLRRDAAWLRSVRNLFEISEALLSETDLPALHNMIIQSIMHGLNAGYAALFSQRYGHLEFLKGRGPAEHWRIVQSHWQQRPEVLFDEVKIINFDAAKITEDQKLLEQTDWGSFLSVPVKHKEESLVFMAARRRDDMVFSRLDQEALMILARQAVVVLENARLYHDLQTSLQKLKETQMVMLQAEKLAVLGKMTAALAHEINNPLQSVRNCIHLAMRNDVDEAKKKSYLNLARQELERLASLIDRKLEFLRPSEIDKRLISVEELVGRVLELFSHQMEEANILALASFPPPQPEIEVVVEQIEQVLVNLIINAVEALEGVQTQKYIWVDGVIIGQDYHIFVEDNGPGVDVGIEEDIFEPFFSTKPKGTGLGLVVSYGIVQSHQGTIKVSSGQRGSGACFEIILPVRSKDGTGKDTGR